MKDDFIVPLNGLAQGRTTFRTRIGKKFFEHFENSEILDAELDAEVEVEKAGRFIGVDCRVEGNVTVICDRCLSDLIIPVRTDFKQSVKFGEGESVSGEMEGDREIVWLPAKEENLDLSQAIYDYICLSLPVQRVHEEGECDPEAMRYLSSENGEEPVQKDSSTPFAGLKDLLGKKE